MPREVRVGRQRDSGPDVGVALGGSVCHWNFTSSSGLTSPLSHTTYLKYEKYCCKQTTGRGDPAWQSEGLCERRAGTGLIGFWAF